MEMRTATSDDIPKIVDLLKLSLGETLLPKSERYWRWKHIENPFGPSPVLLSWDGDLLVGVRAFMRWKWVDANNVYSAVRAVDTATHPEYQGKGIFKKLTLSLVDNCTLDGDHFVFNTPNLQSMPGYLKMGWVEAGRLSVGVSIERPWNIAKNYITNKKSAFDDDAKDDGLSRTLQHPGLNTLLKNHFNDVRRIHTNVSSEYLRWRYVDVPVVRYFGIADESGGKLNGLILGRIKTTKIGRELRITDFFLDELKGNALKHKLSDFKKKWQVDYCSWSGTISKRQGSILDRLHIKLKFGPIVTTRTLKLTDLKDLHNFKNWEPTLGDLELF